MLSNKTIEYNVEVHSVLDDRFSVVMKNIINFNNKNNIIYFDCALFKEPLNLFLLLKLLGIKTDKDLVELLCFDISEPVLGNIITSLCNETMINYKKIMKTEKIENDDDFMNYILKQVKYKNINKEYKMNADDKKNYLIEGLEKKDFTSSSK